MKPCRTLWIPLMAVCLVALAVPAGSGDPPPPLSETAAYADSMIGHRPTLEGVPDELPLDDVLNVLILVVDTVMGIPLR